MGAAGSAPVISPGQLSAQAALVVLVFPQETTVSAGPPPEHPAKDPSDGGDLPGCPSDPQP